LEWGGNGLRDVASRSFDDGAKSSSPPTGYSPNPSHDFRRLLVTPPLSIKLFEIMGGYKGRTNVRHRKRRSAKAERIKAISAKKEDTKKTA
jgi:hypothetical protein